MTNPSKSIPFSTFQEKIFGKNLIPQNHEMDVFPIPDIPRLFPRNIRCSFQNLHCREQTHSLYHQNFVLKIHLKGSSTGVVITVRIYSVRERRC